MGPEVGPAFQRRSRATLKFILSVRLAETVSRHVGSKEMRTFWYFDRGITYKVQVFLVISQFSHFVTGGANYPAISCFRIAIRTAARARAGPAHDMDDIRE
eukprot:gene17475-biopygen14409